MRALNLNEEEPLDSRCTLFDVCPTQVKELSDGLELRSDSESKAMDCSDVVLPVDVSVLGLEFPTLQIRNI